MIERIGFSENIGIKILVIDLRGKNFSISLKINLQPLLFTIGPCDPECAYVLSRQLANVGKENE